MTIMNDMLFVLLLRLLTVEICYLLSFIYYFIYEFLKSQFLFCNDILRLITIKTEYSLG